MNSHWLTGTLKGNTTAIMVINYTCVFAAAALKKKTKVCNKADVAESWSLGGSECETRRSGDYWLNLTPVGRKLG